MRWVEQKWPSFKGRMGLIWEYLSKSYCRLYLAIRYGFPRYITISVAFNCVLSSCTRKLSKEKRSLNEVKGQKYSPLWLFHQQEKMILAFVGLQLVSSSRGHTLDHDWKLFKIFQSYGSLAAVQEIHSCAFEFHSLTWTSQHNLLNISNTFSLNLVMHYKFSWEPNKSFQQQTVQAPRTQFPLMMNVITFIINGNFKIRGWNL